MRRFQPSDVQPIAQLFHDTIRTVNLGDYTQAQVEAWAPDPIDVERWAVIGCSHMMFVADEQGELLGFADVEPDGHLDHLFVHHGYQRQGVATALHAAIEEHARGLGLARLFTEASITARPFFLRMGYREVRQQTVVCRGVEFINYVMEKRLAL